MKTIILILLIFATLNVYLLVSAPTPLPDTTEQEQGYKYPIETAFRMLAHENDVARTLYTKGIVGQGKKQQMNFDEHWKLDSVEAGPLPALFLRSTALEIEKSPVPLGLFLGSDFPITPSNQLEGKQLEIFKSVKNDLEPRFFYDADSERHTALFPDLAVAAACVNCHNSHPESPKTDWKLGDVMGAATWTYPKDSMTFQEMNDALKAYRNGVQHTYKSYLEEVEAFKGTSKPTVSKKWPKDGYYLPEVSYFIDSIKNVASTATLNFLLNEN